MLILHSLHFLIKFFFTKYINHAHYCQGKHNNIRLTCIKLLSTYPFCTDNATGPVLCVPIHQENGELVGVLELLRSTSSPQFGPEDEEMVEGYLSRAALAVQYGKTQVVIESGEAQHLLNDAFIALSK